MYLLVFAQLQISLPPMMIVTLLTDLEDLIVSFSQSNILRDAIRRICVCS